ncbi:MAG: endo alpha-1,4 polygalactosaminidase, partial [Acidimicrobiales bacterium]
GFDAVETDLDETYNGNEGTTGFTITESDEQTYLTTLADYMHSLGLGWIAKNLDDTGDDFAGVMEPLADGIVTEQCNQNGSCGALTSYMGEKAIFNAEYESSVYPGFCTYDDANDIDGALFDVNLDGPRSPCPGPS